MRDKCIQYDDKIARYRRLSFQINDRQTLDGIAVLIAEATDAKALIHPSPPEKQGSQWTASHSELDSREGSLGSTSIYFLYGFFQFLDYLTPRL